VGEANESRISSLSESDNTPRANFGEHVQVVIDSADLIAGRDVAPIGA
jgi:hypothetical protein